MKARLFLTAALLVAGSELAAMPPLAEPAPPPLLMSATAREPAPPASLVAPKSDGTFAGDEKVLKAAIANAVSPDAARSATVALARFYARHDLYVEALGSLTAIKTAPEEDSTRIFKGECEYRLGRYDAALSTLSDERLQSLGDARTLRAMTLARLGAFRAARTEFSCGEAPSALRGECRLLEAESAIAVGDLPAAEPLLRAVQQDASRGLASDVALLAAKFNQAKGGDAAKAFRAIVRAAVEPAASRAALAAAMSAYAKGELSPSGALEDVRRLALRWSDGAFAREALVATATLADKADIQAAFAARRKLAADFARSDDGEKASADLTAMLAGLLDRSDLSPGVAAQLFYENIDHAPPGREGDLLIRRVARELAALDLAAGAAELLEHQVFKRLRGTERSSVAADLAELYLADRRPNEALRVIRSTRIAGLASEVVARRNLIEAAALGRTGAFDAAMQILSGAEGTEALQLRADIHWRQQSWREAAAAYRDLALAAPAPLDGEARSNAVRAAAAFLKAGDEAGFGAFREAIAGELAGTREAELLSALAGGDATASILEAYRDLFRADSKS